MATRLFVGNLPENSEESDIRAAFSNYGKITGLDLKSKSAAGNESKKFAFVTISGSNYDIESCIKHFSSEDFKGSRLYVTRARESFLERLQRERLEAQQKEAEKNDLPSKSKWKTCLGTRVARRQARIDAVSGNRARSKCKKRGLVPDDQESPLRNRQKQSPAFKNNSVTELNLRKRKNETLDHTKIFAEKNEQSNKLTEKLSEANKNKHNSKLNDKSLRKIDNDNIKHNKTQDYWKASKMIVSQNGDVATIKLPDNNNKPELYKKKQESDLKRMEAMKKKRQEFREKQMILKTGLTGVDKVTNKKIVFSDNEDETSKIVNNGIMAPKNAKNNTLFDDDGDSGDDVNFEIKKQFEGKKGQQVLDLQSRYKSDKRFALDERFIEEDEEVGNAQDTNVDQEDQIDVKETNEKDKQLNILQDVLGIPIKRKFPDEEKDSKKNKHKLGMLRFNPSQPEHAKFLAPVEDTKQESTKKSKKKKDKKIEENEVPEQKQEEPRPEVSKEQFYKVSDTLKEAIAQPTTFTLRSLFGNNTESVEAEPEDKEASYIALEPPKRSKVNSFLEPREKNPFVYDSSDSETEEIEQDTKTETPAVTENKAVWKENFFFALSDQRLEEGLSFFLKSNETEVPKERRELKSLMKKRIYNKERKDQMQMFKKKIGGRKKSVKKSFRRKN